MKPTEKCLNARIKGKRLRMKKLTGRWPTQFWLDGWRKPRGSMWLRGWRFLKQRVISPNAE